MPTQFIRAVTLIVSGADGNGLDLSKFRITFQSTQSDIQTLNTLKARVYNLSDATSQQIQKEYTQVTLQAGYEGGNIAVIFQGSIKQIKRGRENQTETFLQIFAADGDIFYTQGTVNKTLAAGWTQDSVVNTIAQSGGIPVGDVQLGLLNPAPRGKVMYGMGRAMLRTVANSTLTYWSVQNGKIQITPLSGYKSGEAVVLNSATGLIGLPEQTEDGIALTCLLNPKIQPGNQIQINQASIQTADIPNDLVYTPAAKSDIDKLAFYPPTNTDGFYKVFVAEHRGDTRGNEYYTDIIALSIGKTAPQDQSVKIAG